MNTNDTSFILRTVVIVLGASIFVGLIGMFASAWHWGDGEGIRIIDAMTGPLLAAFASLSTVILSHFGTQIVNAVQQTKQVQAQATPAPSPSPAPSAPQVPQAAQQPAI